jgi:hypothetical protein
MTVKNPKGAGRKPFKDRGLVKTGLHLSVKEFNRKKLIKIMDKLNTANQSQTIDKIIEEYPL